MFVGRIQFPVGRQQRVWVPCWLLSLSKELRWEASFSFLPCGSLPIMVKARKEKKYYPNQKLQLCVTCHGGHVPSALPHYVGQKPVTGFACTSGDGTAQGPQHCESGTTRGHLRLWGLKSPCHWPPKQKGVERDRQVFNVLVYPRVFMNMNRHFKFRQIV